MNHQHTNNYAIASLVLGILSIIGPAFGVILGIIGIIFSRKAMKIIHTKPDEGGTGLASAGLICSIVGIALQLLGVLLVVFFFLFALSSSFHFS